MLKAAFNASRSAGLLPAFGWTLLIVALLALVFGAWAGKRWEKGANAIAANKTLRKDIEELTEAARALQQHGVDSAIARDQAAERLDLIATQREDDREETRLFLETQRTQLGALLAKRPDLHDLRLGDDVLRHWNRGNEGPAASGPAAAEPAGKPARPVPAAAAGQQRRGARADRQPRRSDGAVPRLQEQPGPLAAGAGRVGSHGVELVLQRGGSSRPRRIGVPQA